MIVNFPQALRFSISLIALALCINANAHESHQSRIQHLEHKLDQSVHSESAELLLLRADLHRRQKNWDAALHDYQVVADKEPENSEMMLGRAQLHLDQHQFFMAIKWSTRLLDLQPDNARASLHFARALAGIGQIEPAIVVFERAIHQLSKPRPEHYIELAQIVNADGSSKLNIERAVAILDKGAVALGNPVSLHNIAYQLELESGYHDAALQRAEKVLARNSSLLNWRLQRGELLLETGRYGESRSELSCLIHRIRQLPTQRRNSRAFALMLQRGEDLLARLNAVHATATQPVAARHAEFSIAC